MRSLTLALVVAMALLALRSLDASETASALTVTKCSISRANDYNYGRFAGWERPGYGLTPGGVYSQIYNYTPYVSTQSGNFTSAWVMLTIPSSTTWAQVGWEENPYGDRHTFYQVISPTVFVDNKFLSPMPAGSYIYYTTFYNHAVGNHVFTFQVNNQDVTVDGSLVKIEGGFTPTSAQIFGETHTLASQMPGDLHSGQGEEGFFNSSVFLSGAWQWFSGTPAVTDSYELTDGPYSSGSLLYIYDRDC